MRFIPSFPLLACMALWLLSPVPSPADKPNIVLILADDMGWSDLGCYGSEIPTPHLDSLAAQGMLATRCYTASRCSPSRASIMTGCEPHKVDVGLLDDDSGRPGYRGRLNPDIPILPELLKKAGYRTYLSGKWHLGKVRGTYPWDRGFDRSRGLLGGAADYYKPMPDRPFGEDGKLLRPEDLPENFYMTEDITQTALAYIDDAAKSKKPFFLYVAYTAPHTPLQAPREEIEKMLPSYRGKSPHAIASKRLEKQKQLGIVPPSAKLGMAGKFNPSGYEKATAERKDYLSRCMATYAAQISIMDRGIGRILASLDRHRLSGNTIVMFLSDNGATAEMPQNNRNKKTVLPIGPLGEAGAGTGTVSCGRPCPTLPTASIRLRPLTAACPRLSSSATLPESVPARAITPPSCFRISPPPAWRGPSFRFPSTWTANRSTPTGPIPESFLRPGYGTTFPAPALPAPFSGSTRGTARL